jgi:hypothetical protein
MKSSMTLMSLAGLALFAAGCGDSAPPPRAATPARSSVPAAEEPVPPQSEPEVASGEPASEGGAEASPAAEKPADGLGGTP